MEKCENFGAAIGFLPKGKFDRLACIPDYDAGKPERTRAGTRVIRFGGDATYGVLCRCEHGGGFHARLIWSRPVPTKSRARHAARTAALG
jgi:hypothetical protein